MKQPKEVGNFHQDKQLNQPDEKFNLVSESKFDANSRISKKYVYCSLMLVLLAITVTLILILREPKKNQTETPQPDPVITDTDTTTSQLPKVTFTNETVETDAYLLEYQLPQGKTKIERQVKTDILKKVDDFKAQAQSDRVNAVAEMGELPEYLKRPYQLNISGEYYESAKYQTKTIVQTIYSYTGGAKGTELFDVTTLNVNNDAAYDSLQDIIEVLDRQAVKEKVVKALEAKKFNDQLGSQVLFPQALQELSLANIPFGINRNQLILYFSEYLVSPGVFGAFTVELDIDPKLVDLLQL